MVSIKSTVIFITVAINLLVDAAPVHTEKNDGSVAHVSLEDGVQSKALGIDLNELGQKGKGSVVKRDDDYYRGRGGRGNYNYNGVLPFGGPGYGFGRSNVNVNGFTRPIGFEDDNERFDDVSAAKRKVKRDHHDHDDFDDDDIEALALSGALGGHHGACNIAKPNICASQGDWEGFHGFMKRHDLDDSVAYTLGHHWGCPTVAPPCLPHASHAWGGRPDVFAAGRKSNVGYNGIFTKRSEESTGESTDDTNSSENKRDTVKVEGKESAVTITSADADTAAAETDLNKRDHGYGYRHHPYYPGGGYIPYNPYYGLHHGYRSYYPWGRHYDDDDDFYDGDYFDEFDHDGDHEHGDHGDRFEKRGEHSDEFDYDDFGGDDDDDHFRHGRYRGGYYRHGGIRGGMRGGMRGGYRGGYRGGNPYYRGGRFHGDFDKRAPKQQQQQQDVTEAATTTTNGEETTTTATMQKRDHVNVFNNENYNVDSGNQGGFHGEAYRGVFEDYPYTYHGFSDEFEKRDHLNVYNNENYNLDSFNTDTYGPGYYWPYHGEGEWDKRDHLNVYNNENYNLDSFNTDTYGPGYYWPYHSEGEWDKRSEKQQEKEQGDENVNLASASEEEGSSSSAKLAKRGDINEEKRDHIRIFDNYNYNEGSFNQGPSVHYRYPPVYYHPRPYYPWALADEEI